METQKINHSLKQAGNLILPATGFCRCLFSVIISIRILLLLMALVAVFHLSAQKIWEERRGCVRAQGNLAPGYLFQQKAVTGYVNGDLEVFPINQVGIIGAAWGAFTTSQKNQPGIKGNHSIFCGANYHFLKPSRWDPFIGLLPGVGIVQATYKNGDVLVKTPYTAAPLVSAQVGCNYYVGSIFHFFLKMQFVTGQVFGDMPSPQRLDELKFSGGLGWNIRAWKPKKAENHIPALFKK